MEKVYRFLTITAVVAMPILEPPEYRRVWVLMSSNVCWGEDQTLVQSHHLANSTPTHKTFEMLHQARG